MTRPTEEAALARRVRAALASAEPDAVPEFSRLWVAADRPRATTAWRPALAVAGLAAAVLGLWRMTALHDEVRTDLALAARLHAELHSPSPLDALGAGLPDTLLRGTPEMPQYSYPLLPKETLL